MKLYSVAPDSVTYNILFDFLIFSYNWLFAICI
ncbi:hypothetical protein Patl1_19346 [Pistacia atlantica]|uniref:Uncharacterized protein n=1 Tax=Pistacia atlantica TaxID=434234 RepID=A0ACC1C3V3_9ROSI|nr:hypothetical protein Patl1_19346 [Pistacia atlantica]